MARLNKCYSVLSWLGDHKEDAKGICRSYVREGISEGRNFAEFKAGCSRGHIYRVRSKHTSEPIEKYGLPPAETARQLGVSTSAVSKMMNRRGDAKSTSSTKSPEVNCDIHKSNVELRPFTLRPPHWKGRQFLK